MGGYNMKNYLVKNYNNGFDFFDEAIESFFKPMFYDAKFDSMKTDIKEVDGGYALEIEMPGFDKSEITLSLEKGYLTIGAAKKECVEESGKKDDVKYIRKERSCRCERSYYVGEYIREEDVKAKYDNGILEIKVPKNQPKHIEVKKIEIE